MRLKELVIMNLIDPYLQRANNLYNMYFPFSNKYNLFCYTKDEVDGQHGLNSTSH